MRDSRSRVWLVLTLGLLVIVSLGSTGQDTLLPDRFVCIYYDSLEIPVPSISSEQLIFVGDIPFVRLPWMSVWECPGPTDSMGGWNYPFPSGLTETFGKLHVLTSLGFATALPDGYVAGQLVVTYVDGSESVLNLVAGVNTAEWAYDRADNQKCLAHRKIPPAYSYLRRDNRNSPFYGHEFLVTLDLEAKPIKSIEIRMPPEACKPRPTCGGDLTTWLRIHVSAMTLER